MLGVHMCWANLNSLPGSENEKISYGCTKDFNYGFGPHLCIIGLENRLACSDTISDHFGDCDSNLNHKCYL